MDDSLFNGLGCVRDFVYDIDLVENPSFHSSLPRRIPHSLREAVKKELDCMQELGVIEPISEPTPVLNAMVIVRQKVFQMNRANCSTNQQRHSSTQPTPISPAEKSTPVMLTFQSTSKMRERPDNGPEADERFEPEEIATTSTISNVFEGEM
ncbi:uncharacterized protein LOC129759641 isoform X1 [Uranotaenia lowii]|uniref:uncharacterized protein LOC129759641 isoform X1 n=1 Tax=Uranotaenia lowii TaxID=190385 RepID=UPI00247A1123|nr:uncharacterized protein LOC129759641 isoform X1 [Uranotaenia lowii]